MRQLATQGHALAHRTCHDATLEFRLTRSGGGEEAMSKPSSHTWIVDVIEDGSASIEVDGRSVTPIPEWMLPVGVREGDVLAVTHEREQGKSILTIRVDPEAKKRAMDRSQQQVSRQPKGDRGGDIQL